MPTIDIAWFESSVALREKLPADHEEQCRAPASGGTQSAEPRRFHVRPLRHREIRRARDESD